MNCLICIRFRLGAYYCMAASPKKMLIIAEYFYPAGQDENNVLAELFQMVNELGTEYHFYCIAGGYDVNGQLLPVKLNHWNELQLDNGALLHIWYDNHSSLSPFKLHWLMAKAAPDIIYLNGFMSIPFQMNPLWVIHYSPFGMVKTIIAPRGKLAKNAIRKNSWNSKWFIWILRFWGLTKNNYWHLNYPDEKEEIAQYFKVEDDKMLHTKDYRLLFG